MADATRNIQIVLETGKQRAFASALDWPGWSRSGKTEEAAISALLAYADRYRPVVHLAGLAGDLPDTVEVVDRQPGNSTTSFGAPDMVYAVEHEAVSDEECARHLALLRRGVAARVGRVEEGPARRWPGSGRHRRSCHPG